MVANKIEANGGVILRAFWCQQVDWPRSRPLCGSTASGKGTTFKIYLPRVDQEVERTAVHLLLTDLVMNKTSANALKHAPCASFRAPDTYLVKM